MPSGTRDIPLEGVTPTTSMHSTHTHKHPSASPFFSPPVTGELPTTIGELPTTIGELPTTMVTSKVPSIAESKLASIVERKKKPKPTCDKAGSTCNPDNPNHCCSCQCIYGWPIGYVCGGGHGCGLEEDLEAPPTLGPDERHNVTSTTPVVIPQLPEPKVTPYTATKPATLAARQGEQTDSTTMTIDGETMSFTTTAPAPPPGQTCDPAFAACDPGQPKNCCSCQCIYAWTIGYVCGGGNDCPPPKEDLVDPYPTSHFSRHTTAPSANSIYPTAPPNTLDTLPPKHTPHPPSVEARDEEFIPLPYCNNGPCPHPTTTNPPRQ